MYKDLSDSVKKLYGAHMSFIRLCINKNNRHVTDIYFVISDIKMAKMGCRENINWKENMKRYMVKLLNHGNTTLEIGIKLNRNQKWNWKYWKYKIRKKKISFANVAKWNLRRILINADMKVGWLERKYMKTVLFRV